MTINSMATIMKMTETPFEFVRKKTLPNLRLNFDCVISVKTGTQAWSLKKDMESCPGFAEASFRSNDKLFRGASRLTAELGNPSVNGRPQRAPPTAFKHLFFTN